MIARVEDSDIEQDGELGGYKNGDYVFVTPTNQTYRNGSSGAEVIIRCVPGFPEHSDISEGLWWPCELRPATEVEKMEARLLGI